MVLGQVMLPVLAGKKVSGLMVVTGSGIHDPCAGVTEANKFRNVSVHHSVNGWCLRRTGNFNLMKKSFDSSSLISRASSQAPFNPLQYQSYSIPSLNWRNKGVKRLIEGYNTQEVIQRGRPVEFSESTIASLFSEHNGICNIQSASSGSLHLARLFLSFIQTSGDCIHVDYLDWMVDVSRSAGNCEFVEKQREPNLTLKSMA